jgi:uncharacterized protein YyaL (SSP411 family)
VPNRLARATSPYLLQHQDNPVDWREWSAATLAEARALNRPILLSVGYAACHWCHVMAHESFEDPATAALMNRHFINVKVDREERPDLDAIYQMALGLLGEQGGWPLTMFLTPSGEPFWGGTYFPPEPRYGRPSFRQVLERMAEIWATERDKIEQNRRQLAERLGRMGAPQAADALPLALGIEAARDLAEGFDTIHGGLMGAPKFPQAPLLDGVWRYAIGTRDGSIRRKLRHTLNRICQGGIYDHLGGGFARYAVDAYWLVPHFEKMLYDNAQLLGLLATGFAETGDPLFRTRAVETVGWLVREMRVEQAFASSLDADSEGHEGRFYVWEAAEIDAVLGHDARVFKDAYGITERGNFEGRNVLNRLHEPGLPTPEEEAVLAPARARLLEVRARRVRPARDDKVLADWNGLLIRHLARAGAVLGEPGWVTLAADAFDWIDRNLGADGDRLVHSWRQGRRLELGFLDDLAHMAAAAVTLYEITGERRFLERAVAWTDSAARDFRDPTLGGHFLTAAGQDDLIVRAKSAHDGPVPAANATLLEVQAALFALTGEDRFRRLADETAHVFAGEARRSPAAHMGLLAANLMRLRPIQVVIRDGEGRAALERACWTTPLPAALVCVVGDAAELPARHPAHGKTAPGGRASAHVCVGPVCGLPVSDADSLRARLVEASVLPEA